MTSHLLAAEVELAAQGDPGSLDPERRAHLDSCADCRKLLEASRADSQSTGDDELPTRQDKARSGPRPNGVKHTPEPPPASAAPEREDSDTELEVKANASAAAAAAAEGDTSDPGVLGRGASVGRYIVLGTLGQGGMGVVYAAYDAELDRKVAIKLVRSKSKEGQARLVREAQAMAKISHPNVISVYDVGTLGDRVYVTMEFVEGFTLRRWVKEKPHTWREALEVFTQAGKGLAAAHAVGLVHRDFKPENVLIGKDGRVFVMDFGLARLAGDTDTPAPGANNANAKAARKKALLSQLTQEGLVVGTPHYMAPEQHTGRSPDTRTDQFAFCAALYWALWNKRPFDPQKLADTAAELDDQPTSNKPIGTRSWTGRRFDGVIADPPSRPRVPTWVRKMVLRGLSLDPADRFPSMDELLRGLEVHPQRQRNYTIAAGLAVLLSATGVVTYRQAAAKAEICSGGAKMVEGAWDDRVRGALSKSFLATGVLDAKSQAERTASALDEYATSWTAMHRDACEATRVRKEQTEDIFALRMLCLDRRLRELKSLTGLLAAADEKMVSQSTDAVLQLPSVRHCADVAALSEPVPRPTDPEALKNIEALTTQLAEINALRYTGRYPQALGKAQEAWKVAAQVKFKPVEAETLYLRGLLEDRTGKVKEGEQTLVQAVLAADAGKDDLTRASSLRQLLYIASRQERVTDGYRWAEMAQAALQRMGGNREVEADLLQSVGQLYLGEGRYDDAVNSYERALKLVELELGKDHYKRGNALVNLGNGLLRAGRTKEAVPVLFEAISLIEKTRGADHPILSGPLVTLAEAEMQLGQFDSAHSHLARGLAIARARYGPNHPKVANFLDLQGTIYEKDERWHEALGAYQAALEIKLKSLPADSPDLSHSYDGIGHALLGLGKAGEALPMLEKALKLRGPDPVPAAQTKFALARALWDGSKDKARARSLALQARAVFESAKQPEDLSKAQAWLETH